MEEEMDGEVERKLNRGSPGVEGRMLNGGS